MSVIEVTREQVLAYRFGAQGLGRDRGVVGDLGVLDLGVQDTNADSARLAVAARLPDVDGDPLADPGFTLLWSVRGAPHLHRSADVARLATALWPVSDDDARSRLAAERKPLAAAGIGALEAFDAAAKAMHDVVAGPMHKGEVSAAVTARLPEAYSYACRSCRAIHVYGGLFQLVGLGAGVALVPGRSPTTLAPLDPRPPVPSTSTGPRGLILAYLRLYGPATLAEAGRYLGTTQTAIRSSWPEGVVEVRVDGRRAWIPEPEVDALREAPVEPGTVRLLPPADPFLQARDRGLLVPDRERQKAVWRILGNPGVVLAGGEVAGVWRGRLGGTRRLDLTVQPISPLPREVRTAIAREAQRVATVRGATGVRVAYEDG